ncbi:hypothetical protein KBTX_01678 [wastewater metagenome]|uniref:Uncharacterized protein n=2 Tax=unclassified sequences TaxID=12908 RepID=A0A5B8RF84_9ZZZZ|nr:hypothetical protein [Arhodomonas sp. KWT]QEA05357.1 hypothetical protein KBTEX_01678 [uncultured organism]
MSTEKISRIPGPTEPPALDRGAIQNVMPVHMIEFGNFLADGIQVPAAGGAAESFIQDAATIARLLHCVRDEDLDCFDASTIQHAGWMIACLLDSAQKLQNGPRTQSDPRGGVEDEEG